MGGLLLLIVIMVVAAIGFKIPLELFIARPRYQNRISTRGGPLSDLR
jgi:hypothetical protein